MEDLYEKNKIVIAICGPAHSGKSVFLNQLYSILPTERRYLVRGCPDGEGVWSNGNDQHVIQLVREKGKFTPEFMNNVKNAIETIESDIVLVDVGGIPSKENVEIISHCDYYIILSRDKAKIFEWENFIDNFRSGCMVPVQRVAKKDGESVIIEQDMLFDDIIKNEKYNQGKPKSPKVLAIFESILDESLEDRFYEEDGILKGRVTNLKREKNGRNPSIIALAEKLIREVKLDRLELSEDVDIVLSKNEELLNEFSKKNQINMNLLKEYLRIYMRMFITNEPNFIYRLPVEEQEERFNIRESKRKKYAGIIENRVKMIKQRFLVSVPDTNIVKSNIIDMNKIADFLGMRDDNGVIEWKEEKLNEIIFLVATVMKDMDNVKIYGARPNWLACAIEEIAKENGIQDISFYDLRKSGVPLPRENKYQRESSLYNKTTESYISSKKLEKTDNPESIFNYEMLESEDSVVLYITSKKTILEEEDLDKIVLPNIPLDKKLYISGRLPLWVTTSIVRSYDNTEKSVHQPNKGFIKFASKDFRTLGDIEKEPTGINFTKYLEERDSSR